MTKLEQSIAALSDEQRRGIVAYVREAERTNQQAAAILQQLDEALEKIKG